MQIINSKTVYARIKFISLKIPLRCINTQFPPYFSLLIVDDGQILVWNNVNDIEKESFYITFKAHEKRVKTLRLLEDNGKRLLVSSSTNGSISFWDMASILENIDTDLNENTTLEEGIVTPKYTINTYHRLTAMTAHLESEIH